MSTTVDERVVSMQFDNSSFEKNVKTSMSTLDKFKRKLKFDDCADSFNDLERSANKVKFQGLNDELDNLTVKISGWSMVAMSAVSKLVDVAVDAGSKIVKALAFDNIASGWNKYNQLADSVQTIMSAVKTDAEGNEFGMDEAEEKRKLEYVSKYLDLLYFYSDETSAFASNMVKSLSDMLGYSIGIEDATSAIMGLNAMVGLGGGTAQQAADITAALTDALGRNEVQWRDWEKVVNRGASTTEARQVMMDAAVAEGTLTKIGEKYYIVNKKNEKVLSGVNDQLETYVNGATDASVATTGVEVTLNNFNDTLRYGWFTGDTLIRGAKQFGEYANTLANISEKTGGKMLTTTWNRLVTKYAEAVKDGDLKAKQDAISDVVVALGVDAKTATEYLDILADSELELGRKAFIANQQTKKFSEVIEATQEAAATKWMRIFQAVIGDALEARDLFSDMVEKFYDLFVTPLTYVLDIFETWKKWGGRDLIFGIKFDVNKASVYENFFEAIDKIFGFHDEGALMNGLLDFWETLFGEFDLAEEGVTRFDMFIEDITNRVMLLTMKFRKWSDSLVPTEERMSVISKVFQNLLSGFHIIKTAFSSILTALKPIGRLISEIFSRLMEGEGFLVTLDKYLKETKLLDRVASWIAEKLNKIVDFILKIIDAARNGGIKSIFSTVYGWFKGLIDKAAIFIEAIKNGESVFSILNEKIKGSKIGPFIENILAVLSNVWNTVYKIGSKLFSFLGAIFKKIFSIFTEEDWINLKNGFLTIFNALVDGIKMIVSGANKIKILEMILSIIEAINTVLESTISLITSLVPLVTKLISKIANLVSSFGGDGSGILDLFDTIFGGIGDVLSNFSEGVTGLKTQSTGNVIVDFINMIIEPLKHLSRFGGEILVSSLELIRTVIQFMREFIDLCRSDSTVLMEFLALVNGIIATIAALKAAVALEEIADFAGLESRGYAKQLRAIAYVILSIALALAVIVWAFKSFEKIKPETLETGASMLYLLISSIGGVVAVLALIAKYLTNTQRAVDVEQQNRLIKVLKSMAFMFIALAASTFIMAKAIATLDNLKHPIRSFIMFAALFVGLIGSIMLINKISKGLKISSVMSALGAMSLIILNLVSLIPFMMVADNLEHPIQTFLVTVAMLGSMFAAIVVLQKVAKKIDFGNMMLTLIAMLGIASVLFVLAQVLAFVSLFAINAMNVAVLAGVFVVLALAVGALSKYCNPAKMTAIAGAMVIVSIATIGMAIAFSIIADALIRLTNNSEKFMEIFAVLMNAVETKFMVLVGLVAFLLILAAALSLLGPALIVFGAGVWVSASGFMLLANAIGALGEQINNLKAFFNTVRSAADIGFGALIKWAIIMLVIGSTLKKIGKNMDGLKFLSGNLEVLTLVLEKMFESMDIGLGKMLKWAIGMLMINMVLKGLGKALVYLGFGLMSISIGAMLFSTSLVIFGQAMAILSTQAAVIQMVLNTVTIAILSCLELVLQWLITNIPTFIELMKLFVSAGIDMVIYSIQTLLDRLIADGPAIVTKLITIIIGLLDILNEHAQELVEKATELGMNVVVGMLRGIDDHIAELLDAAVKLVVDFIGGLGKALEDHADEIHDAVQKFLKGLLSVILSFFGIKGEMREKISESAADFFTNIGAYLLKMVDTVVRSVAQFFTNVWNRTKTNFTNLYNNAKKELTDLWTKLKETPKKWIEDVKQFGKDIIQGLINGFNEMKKKAGEAIKGVGENVLGTFKKLFNIASPSKVFRQFGQFIDEGLALGLGDYADKAAASAEDMGNGVTDAVSEAIARAYDLMENGVDMDPTIRPVLDLSNIQNGVGLMNGMLAGDYAINASARYAQSVADAEYNATAGVSDTGASTTTNNNTQTISNTFNISGDDPREIAEEVSRIIQQQIGRRNTVWA